MVRAVQRRVREVRRWQRRTHQAWGRFFARALPEPVCRVVEGGALHWAAPLQKKQGVPQCWRTKIHHVILDDDEDRPPLLVCNRVPFLPRVPVLGVALELPYAMRIRKLRLRRVPVLFGEPCELFRRLVELRPAKRGSELYPLLDPCMVPLFRPLLALRPS